MIRKYPHLMIVEDEEKIALVLKDYMVSLFSKITIIGHGNEVLKAVDLNPPSFMILDVMLPGLDGFEICRKLRKDYDFPILFLTARFSEFDRIIGFDFGADDYVTKPFSPREVLARVRAILKRADHTQRGSISQPVLEVNGVHLDVEKRIIKVHGKDLKLTPTEFKILEIMMRRPDIVFDRSYMIQELMGYEYEGYERTIDAHIKNIRRKMGKLSDVVFIESVYGIGYKFIQDASTT